MVSIIFSSAVTVARTRGSSGSITVFSMSSAIGSSQSARAFSQRTVNSLSPWVSFARPTLMLGDLLVDPDRYEVTRNGEPIPLTRVEFRLLTALIEADGRVLTRDQLLDAVWGRDQADVLDRTVDVHVGRLRDKLGDDADQPRYVATVRGIGYRAARA